MGYASNGRNYGEMGKDLFMVQVFRTVVHRPYDYQTKQYGDPIVRDTVSEYGPYTTAAAAATVGSQKAKGYGAVRKASYKIFQATPVWEQIRDTIVIEEKENSHS